MSELQSETSLALWPTMGVSISQSRIPLQPSPTCQPALPVNNARHFCVFLRATSSPWSVSILLLTANRWPLRRQDPYTGCYVLDGCYTSGTGVSQYRECSALPQHLRIHTQTAEPFSTVGDVYSIIRIA